MKAKNYYKYNTEINYLLNRFDPILDGLVRNWWSKVSSFFFEKILVDDFNLNEKYFVLFLQVEPEMMTYSFKNYNIKTEELINSISKFLPENYYLIIKDHPAQTIFSRFRKLKFFFNLKKLKNVKLASIKFNSSKLIENSECVITGNGTPAFESILHNKKCIVHGSFFYFTKKIFYKLSSINDIKDIISLVIKKNKSKTINDKNFMNIYNIYKSMQNGYLNFNVKLATANFIKKNDYEIFNSFKRIFKIMKEKEK